MDQKFMVLTLDHKEEEISVEEFCRQQSIEYIGWVARKDDGVVEERQLVKRFGEYFWISDISSTEIVVGKFFRKRKVWQTTARLTMTETNPDDYKRLKSCPIVIAVWDLECDDYIDHCQRHSKRYAFAANELKQAKQAVKNEVAVDIFLNDIYVNREFFLNLTHV